MKTIIRCGSATSCKNSWRRGFQRYSFEPECGDAAVSDVPNYEVFYKPWVRQLVSDLAESPAILGWQLGNVLKARNNVRNGIDEGYDWYLDFVKEFGKTFYIMNRGRVVAEGATKDLDGALVNQHLGV